MAIESVGNRSSNSVSSTTSNTPAKPKPAPAKPPPQPAKGFSGVSTFAGKTQPAAAVAPAPADVEASREEGLADADAYLSSGNVETLGNALAAHPADPAYGAALMGELVTNAPASISELCRAGKTTEVADALAAGLKAGTVSPRDVERAYASGRRYGTGLDVALAQTGALEGVKSTNAATDAIKALETAKTALAAAETTFAEDLAIGAPLATDAQKAAATAAFREQNAGLYDAVAKAEDTLRDTLAAGEGTIAEPTLEAGYTALAGTKYAETALDWASQRARTNGPSEALEGVVAAALPTVAATAAATGTSPDDFRARLEDKLRPFMDAGATAVSAGQTAWDFKKKGEDLKGAIDAFGALASGTASETEIKTLGEQWAEKGKLGQALAVAGLAYDLYGAATADSTKERIQSVIAATGDAASIIGGLAQAGRLGSEVLGVSSQTIGTVAGRFVPALGAVMSVASAVERWNQDGLTLGSGVGIAGDLISAAGSAMSATGVGTVPGEVVTALGTGISVLGDGITTVTNDRESQARREALWTAANAKLPADQRIGEETMRYLRGGLFNTQTWVDGGAGALPELAPEVLQRAIETGHLDDLRDLEDRISDEVLDEVNPNRARQSPGEIMDFDLAHADEISAKIQERLDAEAAQYLETMISQG
ncbi:MAG: hypothetical protein QM817_36630 [Archangium sp.]